MTATLIRSPKGWACFNGGKCPSVLAFLVTFLCHFYAQSTVIFVPDKLSPTEFALVCIGSNNAAKPARDRKSRSHQTLKLHFPRDAAAQPPSPLRTNSPFSNKLSPAPILTKRWCILSRRIAKS